MPFAIVRGGRLHYELDGQGEPLVLISGTSFDLTFWEPMVERLRGVRVLRLDNRGTGLSDPPAGRITIRGMADDVAEVMTAAGIDSAHVYGASMGSLIAQEVALRHPDRVRSLVLAATSTGGTMVPSLRVLPFLLSPFTADPEGTFRAVSKLLSYTPEEGDCDFPGHGLSPRDNKVMRRQLVAQLAYTSLPQLRKIRRPTLVLHGERDRMIPPINARMVARLIPRAKLMLVPGAGHLFHRDSPDESVEAFESFLLDASAEHLDERDLGVSVHDDTARHREHATVLFTDIVDSTAQLVAVGDDAWSAILDDHNRVAADLVERHGGRLVKTTGDGVLAMFEDALAGVACAREFSAEVVALGVTVRAGLHSGECVVSGSDICGVTVHVAARVAAVAGAGEIRLSAATRELVANAVADATECGSHLLKGLPGEWPLYSLASPVAQRQLA